LRILRRYYGESIIVGENVKITHLGVRNGEVRFGIEAPPEIPVHREETYLRLMKEKATKIGKKLSEII